MSKEKESVQVKRWKRVVAALAGIEGSSMSAMAESDQEAAVFEFYKRHAASVLAGKSECISIDGNNPFITPIKDVTMDNLLSSVTGKSVLRSFKDTKTEINNHITPSYLKCMNKVRCILIIIFTFKSLHHQCICDLLYRISLILLVAI